MEYYDSENIGDEYQGPRAGRDAALSPPGFPSSNRHYHFSVFLCLALIIVFSGIFVSLYQINESVVLLSQNIGQLKETSEGGLNNVTIGVNNQNALLERVIGKALPIVVPGQYQEALDALFQRAQPASQPISQNAVEDMEKAYLDYLENTPFWIQENQYQQLMQIRFFIHLSKIKSAYGSQEVSATQAGELVEALLESAPDHLSPETFQFAQNVHDQLVQQGIDEEQQRLDQQMESLLRDAERVLNTDLDALIAGNNSEEEIEDLFHQLGQLAHVSDNVAISMSKIEQLHDKIMEAKELARLDSEMVALKKSFDQGSWDDAQSWKLMERMQAVSPFYARVQGKITALEELMKMAAIRNTVRMLESRAEQIDDLPLDLAQQCISLSMTELGAALMDSALNRSEMHAEREKLLNIQREFNVLQKKILSNMAKNKQKALKNYNLWAIKTIRIVDNKRDVFENLSGPFGERDRNWYRGQIVELFSSLMQIDTALLYEPVAGIYRVSYGTLMEDLEPSDKMAVAINTLEIQKKGLEE